LAYMGVLHNWGAGGPDLRVFLQSGLILWCHLPGSGQRKVGQLPCLNRRE
jgi:hypothetical protein